MNFHIIIYFLLFFIFLHLLLYFFNIDIFELFEKNINSKIIDSIKTPESNNDNIKKNIIHDLQNGMEQLKDNLII
tara:strand:+ start:2007 stop:2231 length:225 start_codon:yes stop_codon:yes gene_type:complete